MLKITKLTDYATIIISEMCDVKKEFISSSVLSTKTGISESTVVKILKLMTKKGLLLSHRGNAGGYKLEKKLNEISVLDVFSAIEGDLALTSCNLSSKNLCEYSDKCKVKNGWNKLNNLLINTLKNISVEDIIDDSVGFELKKNLM
ncbi:MAG: FeS assembly SUF system regulator [Candidatus Midichloriaceae bacterium]|jgi:FeS assembly SUF system regulator